MRRSFSMLAVVVAFALPWAAWSQWNPPGAQYGKTDTRDLRIMTWNVFDKICSSNAKVEGLNGWCAQARIVAALQPDVLILQECGDNSGNGTGTGVDSVEDLTITLSLFMRGGSDPFRSGAEVTAYVQKYAPSYDLPFVYVSTVADGFNRNVVLSRYPFTDLNGDTRVAISDFNIQPDLYSPGGSGGIRGFIFAEIDLPDDLYGGDLVVGNAHLKSGGTSSDRADRLRAGQNAAYLIDYWFNGGGTSTPDPRNRILDFPPATRVLDPKTPVIWGGDWNEDENTNSRDGPALWMVRAETSAPGDGTDRDRTDSMFDDARDIFQTGTRSTQGSSKLDYLAWQDSIATLRRAVIFNTATIPSNAMPAQIVGFPSPQSASSVASDHRPVIADFMLPEAEAQPPGEFALTQPGAGAINVELTPTFAWTASAGAASYTVRVSANPDLSPALHVSPALGETEYSLPPGVLAECGE